MNDWTGVFLGVMAVSLAVMAAVQIGLILVALRLAKQAMTVVGQLQQEVRPLIEKANRIAEEASRAASLATLQVERVDRMMASSASRLDETLNIIQRVVSGPVGTGAAAVTAFRAAMSAVRDWKGRQRRHHPHDEDDALFVG